jgi:hypothetical protein
MVLAEASGESNGEPVFENAGVAEIQFEERESLLDAGRHSTLLDVFRQSMGIKNFRKVVPTSQAITNRSDTRSSSDFTEAQGSDSVLIFSRWRDIKWYCGRVQQQSKTSYEKSVWI